MMMMVVVVDVVDVFFLALGHARRWHGGGAGRAFLCVAR